MKCKFTFTVIVILISIAWQDVFGATHFVGPSETYTSLESIVSVLIPGDSVIVRNGTYQQRENINQLRGNEFHYIVIIAETSGMVHYQGGSEAWHLSDCAYLKIKGFEFSGQTGNGVNIDDGGDFTTPTNHIIIEDCTFRDMNASGNNDLLKLSGLDDFRISNCMFLNGSAGGSGIDMVGCHHGQIQGNHFENIGSNAIQAKGGTQFILIEQNQFINAGFRSVNLGGSTGLAFFRPLDAPFEAADLTVRANTFRGSDAPIAFVGCTRVTVENNTIVYPEVWIYRILQETVDTTRFVACGDNTFKNNIVYVDDRLRRDFNIGPNTSPKSFLFQNNLWYNVDNNNWTGPANPGTETGALINVDPQLLDIPNGNFNVQSRSVAIGNGIEQTNTFFDQNGKRFGSPPSIGAFEAGLSANAPFAPTGAEWHYDLLHDIVLYLGYYRIVSTRDTIIDLRTAQIIEYFLGDKNGETHIPNGQLFITSEGKSVYLYDQDDYEHLYTFSDSPNHQSGYTVNNENYTTAPELFNEPFARFNFSLVEDSLTNINGRDISWFTPSDLDSDSVHLSYGTTIIEKIGPVDQGLLAHKFPALLGGFYGKLRCYDDYEIQLNLKGTACDSIKTTTSNQNYSSDFKFNFNINLKKINITSDSPCIMNAYSGNGQPFINKYFDEGHNQIDISSWPKGLFAITFTSKNGKQLHQAIVVHP